MKVIKCRIGKSYFGFKIEDIRAVSQTVLYEEYLGQNKYTLGYFIFRGENIQLVDITKLLAGKYNVIYEKQIIVLLKKYDMGLLVDELVGSKIVKDGDLENPKETIKKGEYIEKLVTSENYPIYDIEKIVKKVISKQRKHGEK